jgi:hypothetical protein
MDRDFGTHFLCAKRHCHTKILVPFELDMQCEKIVEGRVPAHGAGTKDRSGLMSISTYT